MFKFVPGTRVSHPKHGEGIVTENMEDGRTRVEFDIGVSHRYAPKSIAKLTIHKEESYHASDAFDD